MTTVDELMSRDPLELSKTDIDEIIKYHRNQRLRRMSGEKPVKPSAATVDISSITSKLTKAAAPVVKIDRRI